MTNSTRIENLKKDISALYSKKASDRADWADWLFENHIFVVADYAGKLAKRFGANEELAMAAGMLHDVADAVMKRENPRHEEKSLEIARLLLTQNDFTEQEIVLIVDDAIRLHSCHDGIAPSSLEGKVMATADALAHISTNFYDFCVAYMTPLRSREEIQNWGLSKIERDYRKKIQFEEIRVETKYDYERVKALFA